MSISFATLCIKKLLFNDAMPVAFIKVEFIIHLEILQTERWKFFVEKIHRTREVESAIKILTIPQTIGLIVTDSIHFLSSANDNLVLLSQNQDTSHWRPIHCDSQRNDTDNNPNLIKLFPHAHILKDFVKFQCSVGILICLRNELKV
jgi:hypothetical protein